MARRQWYRAVCAGSRGAYVGASARSTQACARRWASSSTLPVCCDTRTMEHYCRSFNSCSRRWRIGVDLLRVMLVHARPWTADDVSANAEPANRLLAPEGVVVATRHAPRLWPLDRVGPVARPAARPLAETPCGDVSGRVLDPLQRPWRRVHRPRLCTVIRSRADQEVRAALSSRIPAGCRAPRSRRPTPRRDEATLALAGRRSPLFVTHASNVIVGGQLGESAGVLEQWFSRGDVDGKPADARDGGRLVAHVEQYLGRRISLDVPA
jgi:hypothetical protein